MAKFFDYFIGNWVVRRVVWIRVWRFIFEFSLLKSDRDVDINRDCYIGQEG